MLLLTDCRSAGAAYLYKGWRGAGEGLERGWRRAGERLEKGWRGAGEGLERGCRGAAEGLEKGWRGAGEGLDNIIISYCLHNYTIYINKSQQIHFTVII